MKILLKKHGTRASVLLAIITATFAVIIAGMAIYTLIKAAKRCDGRPYRGGMYTNDDSFNIPNDKYDTNMVCYFKDVELTWEWDDTIPTGSGFAPPVELLSLEGSPAPIVFSSLNATNGSVVRVGLDSGDGELVRETTFGALGMPVDENGMPSDYGWKMGAVPTEVGVPWELQRSTNMIDWEPVATVQMFRTMTNAYRDDGAIGRVPMYYRAVRQ
jgi:hypothetical protein